MQKKYFLILFFFGVFQSFGQLNCIALKTGFGDSTICYHQNGEISSISFPSREHNKYQLFNAFDNQGRKVLDAGQGLLHGSASLDIQYYQNGAIRSARRTFQPDGGIQHYDVTSFYNEDGTFHHEEDNSWDRQLTVPDYNFIPFDQSKEEIKKETIEIQILNLTTSKQRVLVVNVENPLLNKIVKIRKNQRLAIGTVERESLNFKIEVYFRFEILPNKRNRIFRIQPLGNLTNQFEVVYVLLPDDQAIELK